MVPAIKRAAPVCEVEAFKNDGDDASQSQQELDDNMSNRRDVTAAGPGSDEARKLPPEYHED